VGDVGKVSAKKRQQAPEEGDCFLAKFTLSEAKVLLAMTWGQAMKQIGRQNVSIHWKETARMRTFGMMIGAAVLVASCNMPSSVQSVEPLLTAYAETPVPAAIRARVVDSPALVRITMLDEANGWGITEAQVVRTGDGGSTWYDVSPPGLSAAGYASVAEFLDLDHAWALTPDTSDFLNAGTLYRTTNGGLSWDSTSTPFGGGSMAFLDASHGWVMADLGVGAGSNAIAVLQSTDGGQTWTQTYTNDPNRTDSGESLPLGGLKSELVPVNTRTAWIGGTIYAPGEVYLYRSDDGGEKWAQVALPLPEGAENADIAFDRMTFVGPNDAFLTMRMILDTIRIAIYVSHDAGRTWTLTPTLIADSGATDFLSETEAVIYNGEQFYVTDDGAESWTIIRPDILFGDTFAGMDFVTTLDGWVITADVTNHRALYRTTDGGATWLPVVP